MACHHWEPVNRLHMWPQSSQGSAKKKEGTATKHDTLLPSPPWKHNRPAAATAKCSGQCPDTWSLSLPKTLQLGEAGTASHAWAKRDRVLLAWSAGGRGKLLQLSLTPEVGVAHCHWSYLNKNHLQPHSPKGTTEEGIVTEYHLLVLSHPREHTRLAAATAKCSRLYPYA